VLRSVWQHPTGTELRQSKFAGAGPWRDVDWSLLRTKVSAVKALIRGPLGGVASSEPRTTWTLRAAAAEAREGRRELA
jgi:hypothetical protein